MSDSHLFSSKFSDYYFLGVCSQGECSRGGWYVSRKQDKLTGPEKHTGRVSLE